MNERWPRLLMSRPVLIVTTTVLALEAAVLLLGGRWETLWWLLFSSAAGLATPALNASPSAPLLGRVILVLAAVTAALPAVDQVRSWADDTGARGAEQVSIVSAEHAGEPGP